MRVAAAGVAVSVAVMIISISMVTGFQKEITKKVIGFSGHIEVKSLGANSYYDYPLFPFDSALNTDFVTMQGIDRVQSIVAKPGIAKNKEENIGIVFKGVRPDYDFSFFKETLVAGSLPNLKKDSNQVLVSAYLAQKLNLKPGNKLRIYFITQPVRAIAPVVCGIYSTGLEEHDKLFAFGSIHHAQRIFANRQNEITHYELYVKDLTKLQTITDHIHENISYDLMARNVKEIHPQIFDWLGYLDKNIQIILILMVIVSCINMTTALLILIIERTNMIGVLKALGMNNRNIIKIFLIKALHILFWGLLFGNVVGLGICLLQQHFSIITLPVETYYVSKVPVNINYLYIAMLNAATIIICLTVLVLPAFVAGKTTPVKAIKFD